jgi:hypothetical protein
MASAGVVSIGITAGCIPPFLGMTHRTGVRSLTVGGCLSSGLLLLLVLPNLTHMWQAMLLILMLGFTRAGTLAGAWHELRRGLSRLPAFAASSLSLLVGLLIVTPWIAQIVYRNSWREGAAACGGLMLIIASPIAYILLPGREVEACTTDST